MIWVVVIFLREREKGTRIIKKWSLLNTATPCGGSKSGMSKCGTLVNNSQCVAYWYFSFQSVAF
jgi:hypothetical protein